MLFNNSMELKEKTGRFHEKDCLLFRECALNIKIKFWISTMSVKINKNQKKEKNNKKARTRTLAISKKNYVR